MPDRLGLPRRYRDQKEEQNIVSNWRKTTLGDLLSFSNGKSSPERSDDLPHPVYGSNGIIGFSDKTNADPNTIIVGRVGTYCGSLQYSNRMCWVTDNAIRANAISGNDAKFIFYLLQTLQLNDWRTGSGQPLLNQSILTSIPVTVPDPTEQRAIAHILGPLDDKIELNRRMNETLEEMARALFKSWFIDFDPVRAKMEGRDPGLPKHLADLFPDRLMDSELGPIPEGWEVKALNYCADLNPESWSRKNYPERVEYVDLANTKWGVIGAIQYYLWKDAPSRAKRVLRFGDTIVGTVRPGNGSYSFVGHEGLTGSTGFAVLRPIHPRYREFVYLSATSTKNIERLAHRADGAAYPAVRPNVVAETRVITPSVDTDVLNFFSMTVAPIINRMESNKTESRTLAALRDTLLPRLVSGELRLKSPDQVVEKYPKIREGR